MNDDVIGFFVGLFVGGLGVGLIMCCVISGNYRESERLAVSKGHAHYRITNPTNGTTEFTWNPSCNKTNL